MEVVDYICLKAFGRRDFPDHSLIADLNSAFELFGIDKNADDTLKFEALQQVGFDQGDVNRALAVECVEHRARHSQASIVGHWAAMYTLYGRCWKSWYEENQTSLHVIWPSSQEDLTSRGFLKRVKQVAPQGKVLLVAQVAHLVPLATLAEEVLGTGRILIPSDKGAPMYDPHSVQPWTQNQGSFTQAQVIQE